MSEDGVNRAKGENGSGNSEHGRRSKGPLKGAVVELGSSVGRNPLILYTLRGTFSSCGVLASFVRRDMSVEQQPAKAASLLGGEQKRRRA